MVLCNDVVPQKQLRISSYMGQWGIGPQVGDVLWLFTFNAFSYN